MGDSNNEWGDLAGFDPAMADAWDRCEPLPDDDPRLNAFLRERNITVGDLVRVGARRHPVPGSSDLVLAFAGRRGVKYREVPSGRRWNFPGSEFPEMRVVPARTPAADEEVGTLIVAEGETDAARLSGMYPGADVAILPAGARAFAPGFAAQARTYHRVLVAVDNDEPDGQGRRAGDDGWAKWHEAVPQAARFSPPDGVKDWCEFDGDPPDLPAAPAPQALVVNARDLLALEVPEVASWFDHEVLPIGGLGLMHGWIKSMKSFQAADLLASIAQRKDWCGFEPLEEPVKVLTVQYEIPWPYWKRRVEYMRRHAPHKDLFDENFLTWDPTRRPRLTAGVVETEDEVLREAEANGVQVLLVDPIRRLVRGVRVKDREFEQEARVALRFFERAQELGITVLTVHHDTKGDSRSGGGDPLGITGAGAWAGDPDTIISIALPPGDEYNTSQRRNLYFTSRNGPWIPPRGVMIEGTDMDAKLTYSTEPFTDEDGESQPSI